MISRPVQLALFATLAVTLWLALDDGASAPPGKPAARAPRVDATAAQTPATPAVSTPPVARSDYAKPSKPVDLFASQDWTPPPPPVVEQAPTAPPLPIRVAMVWEDAGGRYVGMSLGDNQWVACERCDVFGNVRPGGVIEGRYRLDKIERHRLLFTFLPLNIAQELSY